MTDRDHLAPGEEPLPLDDSQQFEDPSPLDNESTPHGHRASAEEAALESEGSAVPAGDIATDVTLTDREAAANAAVESSRINRRDVARWGARALAGLAACGVGVGAVLGAGALPLDVRTDTAVPLTEVQPSSPIQSRACVGPAMRVGTADGADALALAAIGEPDVVAATSDGELLQEPLTVTQAPDIAGGDALTQRGGESTLAAAQALSLDVEAVRGFGASECAEASFDQWLVGGSTRTGRQTVLTLANPSEVAASVDVSLFDTAGAVESVGSTGISVAARSTVVLDLAALAPGVADAVVRVASLSAPVTAHLQQTTTRGLESGGFDIVDPVQALTTSVLPGVRVAEASGLETQPDYDDTVPVLRLFSEQGGAVRIVFQAADGSTIASEGVLEPGLVTDFPLDELPVGTHTIRVESDAPVVAGARTSVVSGEGLDFDWVAGGQPRSGESAIGVPAGPGARLHIVSTSTSDQEIVVDGEPVALGSLATIDREVGAGSVVVEGNDLVVGVSYLDGRQIAGFTASPQGPAAGGIVVLH